MSFVTFKAVIQKFDEQGEKTGWSYILVPAEVAGTLKPGIKKSFRVKGKLDGYVFEKVALLPMGAGDFILPLKNEIRKAIGKEKGAGLTVKIQVDDAEILVSPELMECLADEPSALERFTKQPKSHQLYFSNWIESAKTDATKAKRISQTIMAMQKGMNYGEMIRSLRG